MTASRGRFIDFFKASTFRQDLSGTMALVKKIEARNSMVRNGAIGCTARPDLTELAAAEFVGRHGRGAPIILEERPYWPTSLGMPSPPGPGARWPPPPRVLCTRKAPPGRCRSGVSVKAVRNSLQQG